MAEWSQGLLGDGIAILRDGDMVPVDDVIAVLNGPLYQRYAPGPHTWKPIASAPTDGTPVLVCWAGTGYDPSKSHCEDGKWGELHGDMSFDPHDVQPTHWMALPEPHNAE